MLMEFDIKRMPNENEQQYIWRLATAKDCGELDVSWSELADIFNKELRPNDEPFAVASYRKPYSSAKLFYENVFCNSSDEETLAEIKDTLNRIKIEKNKMFTERLETSRWLREKARDDMIYERIISSIKETDMPSIPDKIDQKEEPMSYCLCFGDEHYGKEFKLNGLYGEVLNEYSPEIFEERMRVLYQETVKFVKANGITLLKVYNLGDLIDGIIRVSQLMRLRYGVIESSIRYAKYMCAWLTKLSESVCVEYHMTNGNHSELRLLGQKKGTFSEDNMGEVIKEIIQIYMDGNPNFKLVTNPTGYIFDTVCGFNILGYHGESRDLYQRLADFSNLYNTNIDILICGHFHHQQSESVGNCKDVIRTPSIMGMDDYALKLQRCSNAGATIIGIAPEKGKVLEYTIKLN